MAARKKTIDSDVEREALVAEAMQDQTAAAALAIFNSVSTLVRPPIMVNTAPVRFDTSTNQ